MSLRAAASLRARRQDSGRSQTGHSPGFANVRAFPLSKAAKGCLHAEKTSAVSRLTSDLSRSGWSAMYGRYLSSLTGSGSATPTGCLCGGRPTGSRAPTAAS